jgi:hypothetical protein
MKFKNFHSPLVAWPFFQNSKTKIFISNFKNDFFFQIFHGGINVLFLDPRLPNLFKIYKNYLFTLTKNSIYCIPLRGGMVYHKRA